MSDLHRQIVIRTFEAEDDAVRAVQGLRVAGFSTDDITIAGRDHREARRIADRLDIEVSDEWPDNGHASEREHRFRLVVKAGDRAAFARRVIVDGLIDATGLYADPDAEFDIDTLSEIPDVEYPE